MFNLHQEMRYLEGKRNNVNTCPALSHEQSCMWGSSIFCSWFSTRPPTEMHPVAWEFKLELMILQVWLRYLIVELLPWLGYYHTALSKYLWTLGKWWLVTIQNSHTHIQDPIVWPYLFSRTDPFATAFSLVYAIFLAKLIEDQKLGLWYSKNIH